MMWSRTVVWASVFYFYLVLGKETTIFDVTTIFDIGKPYDNSTSGVPGRVHARTNALGLPLYNAFAIQEKSVKPNITCDSIRNFCTWTVKDWILTSSSLPSYGVDIKEENFIIFQKSLKIFLKQIHDGIDSDVNIYFSNDETISSCKEYHNFKISHVSSGLYSFKHRLCSCHISSGEVIIGSFHDNNYGWSTLRCTYYDDHNLQLRSNYEYELRLESGKFSLLDNFSELKTWSNSITVNYFYIKGDYSKLMKLNHAANTGMSYVSSKEGSEMVSPLITLEGGRLCLTLVFYAASYSKESMLEIFTEGLSTERDLVHTIKDVEGKWNVKHFNIIFPGKNSGPVKLVIKKTNAAEVKIARISSCSPDGNEVEVIPPVQLPFGYSSHLLPVKTKYTATAYGIEPEDKQETNSTLCINGGVWTSVGCACPPGFYGSNCQSGCGRNRFGQDCGGLCSLRQRECQELLMCTYSTGCHCAPGYDGPNCTEKCSDGYYGNNCKQECGHCADSSACDIYTGECSSCEFGFLPPYCKQESVYYPLPPILSSSEYGVVDVSFTRLLNSINSGPPEIYQIQYREKNNSWKTFTTEIYPAPLPTQPLLGISELFYHISERIEGLRDGVLYEVRVLFMDNNFNKYDGSLVGVSEIVSKCDIPDEYNYAVEQKSDSSSINFSWTYVNASSHWCPLEQYEVTWKEDWQWLTKNTEESQFVLANLLPGSSIQFKVRAKTSGGFAPYSDTVLASTRLTGLSSVRNLNADSRKSSSVDISWEPPRGVEDKKMLYRISYKCVDRPACSPGCQTASEGHLSVQDTQVTLSPLLPFTQYEVTVTPEDGLPASIYVGTLNVVPTEVPIESTKRPDRTNTSLTVYWEAVPVCSGFLRGYNYQLTKESENLNILDSGFTRNTSVTFNNLTARTQYTVKVFISTIAGWNSESFLAINVSTSATVPEAVRSLKVYKRGRGMLGLRWADPRATYGQLKSFTITHGLGQDITSHTVEPSHCVVWPDLYCHTIEGLRSNRLYNITVSARNSEVAEDGDVAVVSAVTKESPPSAPENLKVTNRLPTTIELEWNYPEMANGVIRSFLIGVEETEKYDQNSCCQIYPFVETSVNEELKSYTTEVSGLHPASTYFITVSAKTVGLGPSQSLVVSTRPPHLPFNTLPRVQGSEVAWLPQDKLPEVNNSEIYASLIRAHLLLAVLNETQDIQVAQGSGITDPTLDSLLQQKIGKPYYFITEYNQDDDVVVSGDLEDSDSTWGQSPVSLPPTVMYQLVAVQVLEYNSVYNVDLRYSYLLANQ